MTEPLLIIPDVHGRPFWEEIVERYPASHVVFLGDYMDPYSYEGISTDDAGLNCQSILLYKFKYPDRVTLLLGNHDLHYIDDRLHYSRKISADWLGDIQKWFRNQNCSFFDIAYTIQAGNTNFLLTHAGILPSWWKKHFPNVPTNAQTIVETLNANFHKDPLAFIQNALAEVSDYRGGVDEVGSCVWADMAEHFNAEPFPNFYQIFGHTQQENEPFITPHFANLDCRRPFILDDDGEIKPA